MAVCSVLGALQFVILGVSIPRLASVALGFMADRVRRTILWLSCFVVRSTLVPLRWITYLA